MKHKRLIAMLLMLCLLLQVFSPAAMATNPVVDPNEVAEVVVLDGYVDGEYVMPSATDDYRAWAQGDSRWGSLKLGSSSYNVSGSGCTVTSVTKLIIQAGFKSPDSFNVATLVNWLNSNSGFDAYGNLYWGKPSTYASGFTNYGELLEYDSYSSSAYNSQLLSWIKNGYHLVLNVKSGGHWVAVDEAKSIATGQIYIMDSLSNSANADITLTSRYSTFNRAHAYKGGTTPTGSYTVTFNANGGSCSTSSKTYTAGSTLGTLPTPTKNGYDFAGWHNSKHSGSSAVTNSTTVNENMTLYAHWANRVYSGNHITFDAQGGTLDGASREQVVNGINKERGESQTILFTCGGNLVATNYWGMELGVNSNGQISARRDYNVSAQLTVPDGGFVLSVHSGAANFYNNADIGEYVGYNTVNGTTTAYLYESLDGYLAAHKYVESGNAYGELPTPTLEGQEFLGWYTSASGGDQITSDSTYSVSKLYAHWTCAHDYSSEYIPATCQEYAQIRYTCSKCGHSYITNAGGEWTEDKPAGVDESLIETKTQYRYSDYETTTSYETGLPGYTRLSSEWKQSGTGSVTCVKSWPSGFLTSHSLYSQYNKSPVSNSETETNKTTVNSDKVTGYLYFHWCRGEYENGPDNRKSKNSKQDDCDTFCAFYSTTSPSSLTAAPDNDGSYKYSMPSCCKDTYWYYYTPVNTQTYTNYRNLFTYYRWTDWSEWADETPGASDTRKVEMRYVYRLIDNELAAHSYVNGICTVCGESDPDYNTTPAVITVGSVSGKAGDTVTVPVTIADNPGFANFAFVVEYDTAAMILSDITEGDILSGTTGNLTTAPSTGRVFWMDYQNTTANGNLLNLTFQLAADASVDSHTVTLSLRDGDTGNFVDENGSSKKVTFNAGKVTVEKKAEEVDPDAPQIVVESVNARPGTTVNVVLTLKNAPDLRSIGISNLAYDKTKLTLTNMEWLLTGTAMANCDPATGVGVALFSSDTDINGDIMKLTFRVAENVDDGDVQVNLAVSAKQKPAGSSETAVEIAVVSGMIQVRSVLAGDVNGDDAVDGDDALYLLYHTLFGEVMYPSNQDCDFNGDGAVDGDDALYLLYHTLFGSGMYPLN